MKGLYLDTAGAEVIIKDASGKRIATVHDDAGVNILERAYRMSIAEGLYLQVAQRSSAPVLANC